jgi:hypothetical protein
MQGRQVPRCFLAMLSFCVYENGLRTIRAPGLRNGMGQALNNIPSYKSSRSEVGALFLLPNPFTLLGDY